MWQACLTFPHCYTPGRFCPWAVMRGAAVSVFTMRALAAFRSGCSAGREAVALDSSHRGSGNVHASLVPTAQPHFHV